MKAIVAVDSNWGIGYKGKLLQRIPEDMKFFKEKTMGKIVIMGRETFESLPGKAPLSGRINVVLTRDKAFCDNRLIVCNSIEETFEKLKLSNNDDIYVIGGESIYKEFLPFCDELFMTKIEKEYKADKFFPNIDENESWKLIQASEVKEYNGICYTFNSYKK